MICKTICNQCGGNVEADEACKLCDMFASRQAPACNTDNTLFNGGYDPRTRKRVSTACGGQFEDCPHVGDFYRKQALKHGLKSTAGKIYMSKMARFPGDPEAWISGSGDIKRLAEKRGRRVDGYGISTPLRDTAPPEPSIDIADDIVDRAVARQIAVNPEIAPTPKEKKELREKTKDRLTPHWKKKK